MIVVTLLGFLLVGIGVFGILTRRNIIKIIIGFSLMDTGVHLILLSNGYIKNGAVPIFTSVREAASKAAVSVDPVPSALVLTAIVIGLAITALMLSFAVRLFRKHKTLIIDEYKELKW